MTQPAATSKAPKRRLPTCTSELSAKRVASVGAAMARRHLMQFKHLSLLARSVQRYVSPSTSARARDCEKLAQQLVDCLDEFRACAEMDDLAFSLVATDNLYLLDENVSMQEQSIQQQAAFEGHRLSEPKAI